MIPRTTDPARGSTTAEPPTSCRWSRQGGQYLVEILGELDMAATQDPDLATALSAYRSGEPIDVLLDLGDVTFIDSAGLSWLMSLRSAATLANRRLRVRRTSTAVDKVLEMAGLRRYFAPIGAAAGEPTSGTGSDEVDPRTTAQA